MASAKNTTFNDNDTAPADDTPIANKDKKLSVERNGESSGDKEKLIDTHKPITDFFAFSSLADDDEMQFRRSPYFLQYDEESDHGTDEDNAVKKFLCMFPPWRIRPSDVCFKITPAIGAVCYEYFSLSVMDPHWFSRAFGASESMVKNTMWLYAHVGVGSYLYSRRHIGKVSLTRGIFYSMFGSVLFNFGSLVVWGWVRKILPSSPLLRSVFGLISGGALLYAAQDYLHHVDNCCSELD